MAKVTASTGVKLSASTGSLSGSTTITGTDNNDKKSTLATITASGSPQKGAMPISAGTSNGWSLAVTYNSDGTSTGVASGTWNNVSWGPTVSVEVDAPGRSRHRGKSKKSAKGTGRKTAKRATKKKSTRKNSKRGAAARRTKPSVRKKSGVRRKKSARR